jgi:NAD+ synthase
MLTGAFDPVPLGNIKARMRMVVLYAHANKNNMLVAGTSNKSEMLTGYFTKYGDGGCDIEPIGDLYKTDVWTLAKHLALPPSIIEKVPSAELWAGQTDEKELGLSYEKLDRLLQFLELGDPGHYLKDLGTLALSTKTTEEEGRNAINLMIKARHKLSMPPIARKGY